MKVLIFDTETNGLLKNGTKTLYEECPRLLQLSFMLYDTINKKILVDMDYYVKHLPETQIEISPVVTSINGITHKHIENGTPIKDVLELFEICHQSCNLCVGHNISFDMHIVKSELYRMKKKLKFRQTYCTMWAGIEKCNILVQGKNGSFYQKWPKLIELNQCLFGDTIKNLHNSKIDTYVTLRIFVKLLDNIDLVDTNRNFRSKLKKYIVN